MHPARSVLMVHDRPLEVLHLLGSARPEAKSIVTIVRSLGELVDPGRFRLSAWFLGEDGPLADELAETGIDVRSIPFGGRRDPAGAVRLWRELARCEFVLVHRHTGGRSVGALLRVGTRARLITHIHGFAEDGRPLPRRIHLPITDHVVMTSTWLSEVVSPVPTTVVHPGVDLSLFRPAGAASPDDPPVVGAAGRLVPMKGFRHLVEAFAVVRRRLPGARLEIAGEGPERVALEEDIRCLGLAEAVTLLGWQPDPQLARPWAVYAQPSVVEPFGMAALEAMAAGLPVVASDVGGLRDVVVDGVTGRLVPPGDGEALASALLALLGSWQLRAQLGSAGRQRAVAEFGRERMVEQIVSLYETLVGRS